MFQPIRMKKVEVLVLGKELRHVTSALGELGVVHLTEAVVEAAPPRRHKHVREFEDARALFERSETICQSLSIEPRRELPGEFHAGVREVAEYVEKLGRQVTAVTGRVSEAEAELAGLVQLEHELQNFAPFEVPIEKIGEFSFLHFAIGSLPAEHVSAVQAEVGPRVVLMPFRTADNQPKIVAVTEKKERWSLEASLSKAGFKAATVPEGQHGVARELLTQTAFRRRKLELEKQELLPELARIAGEERERLVAAWNRLRIEMKVIDAENLFAHTTATGVIAGWVPADEVQAVRGRVAEITGGRCVVEEYRAEDVAKAGEVPVLMKHSRLIRPFQMLVSAYGLPRYDQVEPTVLVAVTFLVMFGMMFGDVGQGGVILLAGLGLMICSRSREVKDAGLLLVMAGGVAVIAGFIYGSCFGSSELMGYRGHEPLEQERDPATGTAIGLKANYMFLVVAVALGAVIISVGLIVSMVNRILSKDYATLFFDRFGVVGAVFYWGVLGLAIQHLVFRPSEGNLWPMGVLIGVPLLILLFREPLLHLFTRGGGEKRHEAGEHADEAGESFFVKAFEAVIEVYETVSGYLANTISFVRVGAFALAHAGLSLGIYKTKEVVEAMFPAGQVWGVLVVILGNLLVIILEGMIVSIQCVRLQFYEFFSKFFRETGKVYVPFDLRR